jgi:hypothetical protein
MPTSYLPYQPTQDLLLPTSLRDWLPQDHLANTARCVTSVRCICTPRRM